MLTVDPDRVHAERKKLARLVKKSLGGGLSREKVDESYLCWRNHVSKGDSWKLLRRMDEYYKTLWRGEYG